MREVRVYEGSGEVCGVLGVLGELGVLHWGIRVRDLEVLAVIHWVGRNRHSLISSQASQLSLFTQYDSSLTASPASAELSKTKSHDVSQTVRSAQVNVPRKF